MNICQFSQNFEIHTNFLKIFESNYSQCWEKFDTIFYRIVHPKIYLKFAFKNFEYILPQIISLGSVPSTSLNCSSTSSVTTSTTDGNASEVWGENSAPAPPHTSFCHSTHHPAPPPPTYLTPINFRCIFRYIPAFLFGTLCSNFKDVSWQKFHHFIKIILHFGNVYMSDTPFPSKGTCPPKMLSHLFLGKYSFFFFFEKNCSIIKYSVSNLLLKKNLVGLSVHRVVGFNMKRLVFLKFFTFWHEMSLKLQHRVHVRKPGHNEKRNGSRWGPSQNSS